MFWPAVSETPHVQMRKEEGWGVNVYRPVYSRDIRRPADQWRGVFPSCMNERRFAIGQLAAGCLWNKVVEYIVLPGRMAANADIRISIFCFVNHEKQNSVSILNYKFVFHEKLNSRSIFN